MNRKRYVLDFHTDCPLSQSGTAESEDVAAGFGDPLLQSGFDFVVGEEGDVTGMRHRQQVPVLQQRCPRLEKTREDVELKVGDVIVASQVDRGLQRHRLQA